MTGIQLIISVSALAVVSCKPPQKSGEAPSNHQSQTSNSPTGNTIAINEAAANPVITPDQAALSTQDNTSYRLIVSFISIGEGTDRNAKEIFDSLLKDWATKYKKEVSYETVHWGREGEVDFCFTLSEIKDIVQQQEFVTEMKEKFKGHSLVQFSENEACLHKR